MIAATCLVSAQYVAAYFRFSQPQGRFLFPAIGPIALFIAMGVRELARRRGWSPRGVLVGLGGAIVISSQLAFYAACAPLLRPDVVDLRPARPDARPTHPSPAAHATDRAPLRSPCWPRARVL